VAIDASAVGANPQLASRLLSDS